MWINVNTGGTFTLHADIRYELWKEGQEAPGVLTDEYLATVGYMPVTQIRPTYNPITQGLSAQPCISNNGVWEQHFVVYDLDPAIAANNQSIIDAQARARWQTVSPRQIRQALTRAGLRTQVETAVAAGDQDLKDWWEFATSVERQNEHVVAMGAALGQTTEQMDQLFQLAATL
jgi:hypothetical protein